MEKTNFTFVSPFNWMRALGLVLVAMCMAGLQSASAQCPAPSNLQGTVTGGTDVTLSWDAGSADADNHCFTVEIGGDGFACGAGEQIAEFTVCNDGTDPDLVDLGSGSFSLDISGLLQPGTSYQFSLVETCDDPGNNTSGACTTSSAFTTEDDPFDVAVTDITSPECPEVSPGYSANGEVTVTVTDGTSCTGDYEIELVPVPGTSPEGNDPQGPTLGMFSGPAGDYTFTGVGAGDFDVIVTDLGTDCVYASPTVTLDDVTVPDGTDTELPSFVVVDPFLGTLIVESDPAGGLVANVGDVVIPEGSCSYQQTVGVFADDNCDGAITDVDAVSVSAVSEATVDPGTQASVIADGFGNYSVDINWSVGTTELTISVADAAGNVNDITIVANVVDNVDPVVTINGPGSITIPACTGSTLVSFIVTVDDLCDQDVSAPDVSVTGATLLGSNQVGPSAFAFVAEVTSEGVVTFEAEYTDAAGNTGSSFASGLASLAAEDAAPVVIAAAENASIAACEASTLVVYGFTVTDDCATPALANVSFDDDGAGLTLGFSEVVNNQLYVEYAGNVAAGGYELSITYDDGVQAATTVNPFLNATQAADQAADITLPGNLTFTLPSCQDESIVTFAVQVADDCDDPIGDLAVSIDGDALTPSFTDGDGYFEFTEEIDASFNGAALVATYTDGAGNDSEESGLLTVLSTPDTWAPIVVYPSNDLNYELDPCDIGGVAVAVFEVTATDNCDGDDITLGDGLEIVITAVPGSGGIAGADVIPSPGGDTYFALLLAGAYQVLITATDDAGNEREEDFFIVVSQDPAPQTNLACNDNINVTLNDDCEALIVPDMVLEGNFGCLTDADFEIVVVDGDISNGPIVDGCGEFNYHIELAAPEAVIGFTGPWAPDTWAIATDAFGTATDNASVSITATTMTLETLGAGDFDGSDLDFPNGLNAVAAHGIPADGVVSFDYDYNGIDANGATGWDWFVIDVDGSIIASNNFASTGSVSENVTAGETLMIGIDDDGAAPTASNTPSTLVIDNFVFDAANGVEAGDFTQCWGTLSAEDKTDPVIECPEDTDEAVVNRSVQFINGALEATDAQLDPTLYTCFLDAFNPVAGDHYYDLIEFTVTQSDVYTFAMETDWADGAASLYQGSFSADEPCSNVIAHTDDNFIGSIGNAFDPTTRLVLPLIAGETYVLYASSFTADQEGNYSFAVYSDGNGLVDISPAGGVQPAPTTETVTFELICEDFDHVFLTSPETYVTDANGNTIPGTMSTTLRNRLNATGRPTISDNCGNVRVTVTDTFEENGDCGDVVITRTFFIEDKYDSDCTGAPNTAVCTQEISLRKPAIGDVIFPSLTAFIECDEEFATDANGNPSPGVTGYPFLLTAYGIHDLNQTYCNLGASYVDAPSIVSCESSFKFIRRWDILDWCNPGGSFSEVPQVIKVGDFTAPTVTCAAPGAYYEYSTGPFDCTAAFEVPLPNVTDNCSSTEVHTDVVVLETQDVVNEYGQVIGTEVVEIVVATIPASATNRYVGGIAKGCGKFVYTVSDACGNDTTIECLFQVEDRIEPSAVCDDDLNISVGGLGAARVYAEDIDEGSSDNCGPIRLEVRRLITESASCTPINPVFSAWGEYVDFGCCDVGDMITIELRVWDDRNGDGIAGNTALVTNCDGSTSTVTDNSNVCWLEVLVEDKIRPYCVAPANQNLDCDDVPYDFDPFDTEDANGDGIYDQFAELFGSPTGEDNCGPVELVELPPFISLEDCGYGTITRRFQARDASNNVSNNNCQQTIVINEVHNYEIKFPKDASANCSEPSPDTIEYNEIACDLLAVSVDDEFFSASGDECYKIFRTFSVINWCEYDGEAAPVVVSRDEDCDGNPGDEDIWVLVRPDVVFYDRDNNENNNNPFAFSKQGACDGMTNPTGYWQNSLPNNQFGDPATASVGYWQYTQHIRVYDDVAPTIDFTAPDPFCTIDNVDCDTEVTIPFTVDDQCTPDDITVKVFLDAFDDGTIDADISGFVSGMIPGELVAVFDAPIGAHSIEVHAEDGCGNVYAVEIPFSVVDCKAPTPICINGLAIELMPVEPETDADGDGDFDAGAMEIWASDFIASPITDCSEPISYSINRAGETPNQGNTGLVLTCDDPSTLIVEIYAWDSAYNPYAVQPNGTVGGPNYDFCETYVLVQDNMFNLCNDPGVGATIAGLISREDAETVADAEVQLSGNANEMVVTGDDGYYEFANLELFYDYTVTPSLDENYLNGVSTFDLVLISKHILGVTPLDSPYKMIAADVNNSQSISTFDLVLMRKLILTIETDFPNNTSWRFVDASYNFPDPTNPWLEAFPEVININDLDGDMLASDFVAVKIGDVNYSASPNAFFELEERSEGTFAFDLNEADVKVGNEYTVDFTASDIAAIQGYQATLTFDATALELVDVIYNVAKEENFGMRFVEEGMITTSWNGEAAADQVLFSLVFRANADAQLSELLGVSSRYTVAEAYNTNDESLEVVLNFNNGTVANAGFELYQNTPNPFKGETVIGFNIPEAADASIRIHDVTGKALKLIRGNFAKGYNQVTVNSNELPAVGVLYYTIETADFTATKKMIIVE